MSDTHFAARSRLAVLLREAEEQGAPLPTLVAIVEEASAEGARRAIGWLNLADAQAGDDIRELRNLLNAWRDTKDTVRQTLVKWVLRAALTAGFIGMALHWRWIVLAP